MSGKKRTYILTEGQWYLKIASSHDLWGPLIERASVLVYVRDDGTGEYVDLSEKYVKMKSVSAGEITMIALKAVKC